MWVKLTEREKENIRKANRWNWKKFIIWCLGGIIVFPLLTLIPHELNPDPSFSEVADQFDDWVNWLIICGLIGGIGYAVSRISIGSPLRICRRCGSSKEYDGDENCHCGGKYEDSRDFKWVNNEKYGSQRVRHRSRRKRKQF